MERARRRLVALLACLVLVAVAVLVTTPVSQDGVRDAVDGLGVLGPPAFVLLTAALGLAFVPGPLLAGASGALFGIALGFVVTVASSVLSAVAALVIARRAGRDGVAALEHPGHRRLAASTALARRHGTLAVVLQRLAPGIPDAPLSYGFGLAGLSVGQIALGTLVGTAPRALSYSALGDAGARADTTQAVLAGAGLALSLILGAAIAAAAWRRRPGDAG